MAEQTTGLQMAKPRTYTDEYRRQVVDIVTTTGRTAMSVAAELGIYHTLTLPGHFDAGVPVAMSLPGLVEMR